MADYVPQTNYSFYVSYEWDYGLRGVPMAGPPGSPIQIVADHAPVCHKVVSWIAQAMDSQDPQPPDWNTGDSNEVLIRKVIASCPLAELMDGQTANTIGGVYIYLLKVPPSDTDNLGIGYPPWDSTLLNVVIPSNFFKNLLQAAQANPTGNYAGMQGIAVPTPAPKPPSGGTTSLTGFTAHG